MVVTQSWINIFDICESVDSDGIERCRVCFFHWSKRLHRFGCTASTFDIGLEPRADAYAEIDRSGSVDVGNSRNGVNDTRCVELNANSE